MAPTPAFDIQEAHRYFSAECFNRAWDFIDKPSRTPEEGREMLQLGMASLWHWSQRPDRTPANLSVGFWQVARIHALLGRAGDARVYGRLSLEAAQAGAVPPFLTGYAYEALARAEALAGDGAKMREYLGLARQAAAQVADAEDRERLLADLETIR